MNFIVAVILAIGKELLIFPSSFGILRVIMGQEVSLLFKSRVHGGESFSKHRRR